MKRSFLTTLAALALVATATALDLTPHWITTDVDGIPIRRPCFRDGKDNYAVTLDGETELTGYAGSAIFNFQKFPRAVMRLSSSPLKPETAFTGEPLERYRAAAARMILKGAEESVLESEQADVLPVNQWTSKRFTFTYRFTGVPMRETVTFLNLDAKQQIVLQIRAREPDFATVSARGEDIIRRWHLVRLDESVTGN